MKLSLIIASIMLSIFTNQVHAIGVNSMGEDDPQKKCIAEKMSVKYLGQTGSFLDWMEIEVTNNTNIPTAWIAIEIIQKDGKYGNMLKKDDSNTIFQKTIGPGESIVEKFYGTVTDGRKIEVKAINMRDLDGKRLIDDNTKYIGSDFPEEISDIDCE